MLVGLTIFAAALTALFFLSRINYLLFHTLVETFSVIVACGIFMIAWNSRRFHQNGFFLFLGVSSVFVAGCDFLHMLAYKNMGVFPGAAADLPTQLWIAARYLGVSSLLAAPFFLRRQIHPAALFGVYLFLTGILLGSVFGGIFPECFREGTGLTPFKIGSEYLICVLLAGSLYLLHKNRHYFAADVLRLLSLAIGAFILAELSFTLYTDVFGFSNMAGHLFKIAGFYLIYRGVIETGLSRPFDLLFRDLKQSEEMLHRQSAELEEANIELEAANGQLVTTVAELETANADLEAFNYSVSHDLRGPLTVISCQCQIVQQLYAGRVDPEVLEFLDTIHDQTMRMGNMIKTLLNFSQLNKIEVQRQRIDMSDVARLVAEDLKDRDPARCIRFDITPGLAVDADPDLLRILLENLLGNAWKYTGKAALAQVEMSRIDHNDEPAYFIRDNGTGFDPTRANELFAPFKRLHDKEEFEGTGIGLATAKRIVERHGGRIWAESAPGQGATFYFSL